MYSQQHNSKTICLNGYGSLNSILLPPSLRTRYFLLSFPSQRRTTLRRSVLGEGSHPRAERPQILLSSVAITQKRHNPKNVLASTNSTALCETWPERLHHCQVSHTRVGATARDRGRLAGALTRGRRWLARATARGRGRLYHTRCCGAAPLACTRPPTVLYSTVVRGTKHAQPPCRRPALYDTVLVNTVRFSLSHRIKILYWEVKITPKNIQLYNSITVRVSTHRAQRI